MPHVTNRLFQTPLIDGFPALLLQTLVVFSLIQSCRGQTVVTGSSEPIVGIVGGEVVLPCYLEPAMPAFDMTVEWTRPDLDRRFVLVRRDGEELQNKKHQSYEGRTSLFSDELKNGNISLKLSKVKLSDKGLYRCYVPGWKSETTVELVVATPSSPVVTIAEKNVSISGVVLQCESEGWYPEPELLWLDAEGKILSAGSTETVRGPDDLYTVSSRVTVEKRHSNNITCRVQQSNINQIRETQKHVPDYFFPDQPKSSSSSGSSVPVIIIGLIVGVIFILAAVLFVWKGRKNKRENKKHNEDEETQRVREDKTESEKEPLLDVKQTDIGHVTPETVKNHNEMETQTANNVQTKEDEQETEFRDHETEVQCPMDEKTQRFGENKSKINDPENKLMVKETDSGHVPTETETVNIQPKEDEKEETESKDQTSNVQYLTDEEQHGEEVKTEGETLSDLDMQMEKLKKNLKTKERDEKGYEKNLSRLLGQKKDKEKQIKELKKQLEEVDRQREETEKKLQEPMTQKEAAEKEKDQEDRELLDTKNDLERQKTELQKQLDKMETAMERIKNEMIVLTEKKMKATKEKEETVKKVEELEKLKNENFKTASASPLIHQTEGHKIDNNQEVAENEHLREERGDQAEQEGRNSFLL